MDKDFTEQELEQEAMAAQPEPASKPAKAEKAAKTDTGAAKPKKDKKKGNGIARWMKELRAELKKVTWPTKKQTANNTMIVIACCLVVGVFIWAFDWIAVNAFSALLNMFGKA